MDEKLLLQALRQIVKEEVSDIVDQKFQAQKSEIISEVSQMMDQKLQDNNVMIKEMIQESKKDTIRQVNVLIENGVEKQIKAIAEGHANILERLPEAEEIDELRSRIRTLERVVTNHTQEINQLKQAN